MANDVTVGIHAETDVPQAANKSKEAMTQMERAVEGLNKKMEGFGKDLILSYIAPMVLLNKAMDFIMSKFEEHRQKIADSIALAEKGESKMISSDVSRVARETGKLEKTQKEKELAAMAPEEVTRKALEVNKELLDEVVSRLGEADKRRLATMGVSAQAAYLARSKNIQQMVQESPLTASTAQTGLVDTLAVQGAVFGMGTISPLQVAMTAQLEESQRQTALLERIANNQPNAAEAPDYTKAQGNSGYRTWSRTYGF